MSIAMNKRSIMTLYSDPMGAYSHQVRIVLAEKGVTVDIINVDPNHKPEDLFDLNPYSSLPTLVDRDLVLYEARIIMEYLDERFPHPPLMPVYPVARAECRRMMYRIERDWYSKLKHILHGNEVESATAKKELVDTLVGIAPVFGSKQFFLSDEFTLVDCCLAALFWRFPKLGIEIPTQAKQIHNYMKRVFDRDSFRTSLSEIETDMSAVECL
ncbi:MAG: stringent starvation protein SspA [Gammaproteobacteria bacterium]